MNARTKRPGDDNDRRRQSSGFSVYSPVTVLTFLGPTLFFGSTFLLVPVFLIFITPFSSHSLPFPFPDNFYTLIGDFETALLVLGCLGGGLTGAWGLLRNNTAPPARGARRISLAIAMGLLIGSVTWSAHANLAAGLLFSACIGSTCLIAGILVAMVGLHLKPWRSWPLRLSGVITILGCIQIASVTIPRMRAAAKAVGYDPTQDAVSSFQNTFTYATLSAASQIVLGLIIAYALYRPFPGRPFFRFAIILPYLAPAVAMAVVFNAIFGPNDAGLANQLLQAFGFPMLGWAHSEAPVLSLLPITRNLGQFGPSLSVVTLVVFNAWCFAGYAAMMLLVGMASIPQTIYDAAEMDGASRWGVFRDITVPLLKPILLFLAVTSWIGAAHSFNHTFALIEGAKSPRIFTVSVEIYTLRNHIEVTSAIAVILLALTGIVSTFQIVMAKARRDE